MSLLKNDCIENVRIFTNKGILVCSGEYNMESVKIPFEKVPVGVISASNSKEDVEKDMNKEVRRAILEKFN